MNEEILTRAAPFEPSTFNPDKRTVSGCLLDWARM